MIKRRTGVKVFLGLCSIVLIGILILSNVSSTVGAYEAFLYNKLHGKTLNSCFRTKIKSGNLSVDYTVNQAIKDIDSMNLNTVNVPIEVDISDLDAGSISVNEKSVKKAKNIIDELNKRNVNVILEPYPWINKGQDYETNMHPKDINKFFKVWKNDVIGKIINQVAVPKRVDALCIASNFVNLEEYSDKWCDIIDFARGRYKGLITYKTNWWYTASWDEESKKKFQEKLNNKVFSKVDYISVAAYFEITDNAVNNVDYIKNSLYATTVNGRGQRIVDELEQLHKKWNKPIFFGELGFPRRNYASKQPWNPEPSSVENGEEQARCFEAYRMVFTEDWFLGFSVFAIGNTNGVKNYYPSNRSKKIIKEWFN
ncbi:hypothetical protein BJV85_001463 [Clostridium acetobutylicum]|uniref:Predicted enzyme with TIM-barrel fold n=1 Tax=Clostridium acetobutylicum (strain ATCC 824 / DSM 792 / JCM 1419 / IAM 19013 / LMG 5710 / NBRC 13948 / NRRL B-527 / VKM B-1787 / 2291 / W) TaxID=272562 RepID=Q97GE6_CLOAB|nr:MULTISPECIES: cellulase family glycosylhydrolase [Clostridium]AAK80376.1 Predicted enzyme with TIM-barrel fold [Clostridium acetobutylicum ATCC 824]ADZ21473.1 enzyme with TIM-barrel fold protein [Clostridium acetobutylicum EA 2018]AEI32333.1 TIM-barrel fold family protein [Clostridium acetobutylicum DSM 1731]AWV79205.1 hydrolase [Clostridium acetobutylicum]MBC2394830.1 cellulase family glycosylhydrolase [Clostridium acetobutylicum]